MEELIRKLDRNLKFKDNIEKYVCVKTVDSNEHEGWLQTIDPMSGNMILFTFNDDLTAVEDSVLIMGHACSSLEVLKEPDEKMKELFRIVKFDGKTVPLDEEERKNRLIACIKKNRLPVVEKSNHVLVVCESVTVCPPYDVNSCQSSSRQTLDSMRKIIKKMDKEVLNEFAEERKKLLGNPPTVFNETPMDPADLEERKNNLIAWIKKNRHPVKERDNQSLVVYDHVKIYPPYNVKSVRSPNPRTLRSMRHLINQMDKEASKGVDKQSK